MITLTIEKYEESQFNTDLTSNLFGIIIAERYQFGLNKFPKGFALTIQYPGTTFFVNLLSREKAKEYHSNNTEYIVFKLGKIT